MKKIIDSLKKGFKEMIGRITSPVVIAGFVSVITIIVSVSGIDFTTITSWTDLFNNIKEVLMNPSLVIGIIVAIFSFFNNPTTKNKF